MIRMHVRNVVVGCGPIPSGITLQAINEAAENNDGTFEVSVTMGVDAPEERLESTPNMLQLHIGMADAAAIAAAVEHGNERPLTHELLAHTIEALSGKLLSVSITRVEATTFFATLDVKTPDGAIHHIDARPSDAIALALNSEVDILASEDLLEQAGTPDFEAIEHQEHERQVEEFHNFVESLNPEDFSVHRDN